MQNVKSNTDAFCNCYDIKENNFFAETLLKCLF